MIICRDLFRTSWGWMAAAYTDRGLQRLVLPVKSPREALSLLRGGSPGAREEKEWPLLRQLILRYFAAGRRPLNLPLDLPPASDFTERTREAARAIPYGATATYGEVAARAGSPGAARAVGQVMNRNPVPLFIPCHRVVAAVGPGGFASGEKLKVKLLKLEAGEGRR